MMKARRSPNREFSTILVHWATWEAQIVVSSSDCFIALRLPGYESSQGVPVRPPPFFPQWHERFRPLNSFVFVVSFVVSQTNEVKSVHSRCGVVAGFAFV
jgi:hypothetical protein